MGNLLARQPKRLRTAVFAGTLLLIAPVYGVYAQSTVTIGFNNIGLSSLQVNGSQFLAYGDFRLDSLTFVTPTGQTISGDLTGTLSVNAAQQRVSRISSWGSITVDYSSSGNRLSVKVTINNQSPNTIQGIWFEPFGLQFPSAVQEYNGSIPLLVNSVGQPAVQQTTYSSGVMALASDDVAKPIQIGFPWSLNPPAMTIFPLTLNTDRVSSYPDSYPTIKRPIPSGASDQFSFSLRFGPPGSTLASLAGDTYQAFSAAFPATLNWTDRRAIGALFLSTSGTGWPTNPRGWLLDPTIDVTSQTGIANLKTRILAYADSSIAILKQMNAQGMVTWDIEGQQFAQPISYVGDPTQFSTLAPEMSGIADAYFQKFTAAGLRVGVTIRPQQYVLAPDGRSAQQILIADPTQLLMNKVAYAVNRWGATLFYVDSNVNPTDPNPIDVGIFQKLTAAFPGVLFMPEHANLEYYAYTAPYKELRQGYTSTASDVRLVYPKSFTVIYTADGPIAQDFNELVTAVEGGDVLLFRGWFADPQNTQDQSIYQQAGLIHPPPTVTFTSPANGSTVSNTISVAASASGSAAIANVQFKVDGSNLGGPITVAPYSVSLNTTTLTNGSHTLSAVALDTLGNSGSASVTVTVSNTVPPPAVTFSNPVNGSTVSNTITVSASVSGSAAIANVQFKVDGSNLGGPITAAPYSVSLNTKTLTSGSHTLSAVATDTLGNSGSASVTVTVSNIVPPPTVSFSSPVNGSTVSNTITVTATASGNAPIASVQFKVDGSNLGGPLTVAPYSISLNTTTLTNGNHTLSAVAVDTLGNSGSASVTVTVSNSVTPPNNAYGYQRSITIAHGQVPNTDQSNFPVLIEGVYPYLATVANGGRVQNSNGYDIIFASDSAGTHLLNWEIESYNPSTGSVTFWVQAPAVSHTTDTVIYLFYGNTSISTFQGNKNGTWDKNYVAVYHMTDNTGSASVADSTSNGNTGAAQTSTSVKATQGEINGALGFNGSTDYINGGRGSTFNVAGAITLQAWVHVNAMPSPGNQVYVLDKGYNGTNESYFLRLETNNSGASYVEAGTYSFPASYQAQAPVSGFSGGWHHVVGTYDGHWNLYIDGVKTTSSETQGPLGSSEPFVIGARDATGSAFNYLNGAIDELRVSDVARSSDWISTEYNNQISPATFYNIGLEQSSNVNVTFNSPTNGSTVSSTITVSASASGSASIASVQFKVDGSNLGGPLTAAPYSVSLNTTTLTNGSHTLSVVAFDTLGNSGSASVTVTVSNTVPPPVVTFSSPANGSAVSNTIAVAASASGSASIASVQFKVDGSNLGGPLTTAPYSVSLNTATLTNGSHTLSAVALDTLGNSGSASVTVTVSNTVAPPTVTFSSPVNGSTVSNTITVSASASGSASIASVQFRVDGANLGGPVTAAPYSVSLNTTTLTNGSHTLSAVALDAHGDSGTASVTVTVSNSVKPPNTGYSYQRSIAIAHGQVANTDQSNFPVVIEGVYPYLATTANGGRVQNSNGYDIIFTSDSAGTHLLNWEIESYNAATGSVAFWVQAPTVSHTADTVIYMFYANPSISAFQGNKNGTWNRNYVAVYHMADHAANTTVADSTSNGNTGTAQASTSAKATAGEINGALSFNGSTDYINGGAANSLSITGAITFSAWVNLNSLPSNYDQFYICGKGYNGNNESYYLRIDSDGGGGNFVAAGTESFPNQYQAAASITSGFLGSWHYVTGTYDGSWNVYIDGVKTTSSQTQAPFATSERFLIGGRDANGGSSQYLPGKIDEVRVSNVARTADWISTEYHNQSSPSTFYVVGAEISN
jgi:hypothetical protein